MPKVLKKKNEVKKSKHERTPCTICMDKIQKKTYLMVNSKRACKHKFCYDCIKKWAEEKPQCPNCRVKFNSIKCRGNNEKINICKEFSKLFIEMDVPNELYMIIDKLLFFTHVRKRFIDLYLNDIGDARNLWRVLSPMIFLLKLKHDISGLPPFKMVFPEFVFMIDMINRFESSRSITI